MAPAAASTLVPYGRALVPFPRVPTSVVVPVVAAEVAPLGQESAPSQGNCWEGVPSAEAEPLPHDRYLPSAKAHLPRDRQHLQQVPAGSFVLGPAPVDFSGRSMSINA